MLGNLRAGKPNQNNESDLAHGTATFIGSLPHTDRQAAIKFVLELSPGLCAAPTLPNIDRRELMVPQGLWGMSGVSVGPDGAITVDPTAVDPAAPLADPELNAEPFATLRPFLAAVARERTSEFGPSAPVKFQLVGPITLGLVLREAGLNGPLAYAVAAAAVRQRATDVLRVIRSYLPKAQLVVFIDEPGLAGGLGDRIGLNADQVIDLVSGALAVVEPEAMTGLHCCGSTDWQAIIAAGPQIISLPVDSGISAAAGPLGAFLERGGWVAWGAVPTDGPLGESAGRLWRVLSNQWCELVRAGCDPVRLRRQALVTPQCGLAGHSVEQARQVMQLTTQVGERLHDQIANVQLSVGA